MIYATAKRWGSLLTALFLLPIFFLGCLATDPGDVAMGKQATSNAVVTKTREAKQIDPIVLKNRTFGEAPMLAEKVKVTPHQLSQYLNEVMKLSFYDFINQHRVEAAKISLCNSRQAILDIALIVGFNNKATFNKSFKKYTGMTPSQYRSENQ